MLSKNLVYGEFRASVNFLNLESKSSLKYANVLQNHIGFPFDEDIAVLASGMAVDDCKIAALEIYKI